MQEEIKFTDLSVLNLKPEDIIILKTDCRLSEAAYKRFEFEFKELCKIENKVIILEDGFDIALLRKEETK